MIIQNSKILLEQLSKIEEKIRFFEERLNQLGVEIDPEKLKAILTSQRTYSSLTGSKKN